MSLRGPQGSLAHKALLESDFEFLHMALSINWGPPVEGFKTLYGDLIMVRKKG